VGFKYFDLRETRGITIRLQGYGSCTVTVRTKEHGGEVICRIPVQTCRTYRDFTGELPEGLGEREALYFSIEGKGTFDFISFDSNLVPNTFRPFLTRFITYKYFLILVRKLIGTIFLIQYLIISFNSHIIKHTSRVIFSTFSSNYVYSLFR
jgi:hypothetical protein